MMDDMHREQVVQSMFCLSRSTPSSEDRGEVGLQRKLKLSGRLHKLPLAEGRT